MIRRTAISAALLGALARTSVALTYDSEICGKDGKYTSPDGDLLYGSNAWNPVGDDGFQCVRIQNSPPAMDATWMWDADPSDVHSFPHVRFNSDILPTPMSSLKSVHATVRWAMYLSSDDPVSDDPPRSALSATAWSAIKSDLDRKRVVANVAFDFFADPNKTRVYEPVDAETEIMVWLARLGRAQPLKGNSSLAAIKVSGVDFELFHAKNFRNHNVFTWLPVDEGAAVTDLDADLTPMLEYVRTSGLMAEDSWLGLAEIGSETWYSPVNVTFTAMNYSIAFETGRASNDSTDNGDGDSSHDADNTSHCTTTPPGTIGLAALAAFVWVVAFWI